MSAFVEAWIHADPSRLELIWFFVIGVICLVQRTKLLK